MNKFCEKCAVEIPEDYQNLLCDNCYKLVEEENEKKEVPIEINKENSIWDPNYQENIEAPDKEQWKSNIQLFEKNGVLLWKPTKTMYNFIKNYCLSKIQQHPQYPKFIWRPAIVDVGCGCGVGSNYLSQEASFVWGIDKNAKSVKFAKEAFERIKNNIYYSSQVSFDEIDILENTKETMKFDIVVAIEVIEHLEKDKEFLEKIIAFFDKGKPQEPTEYFISTPNRNNKTIRKDKPHNPYHVREYTSEEFHALLSKYFKRIEFFTSAGVAISEISNMHTPLLAKCLI